MGTMWCAHVVMITIIAIAILILLLPIPTSLLNPQKISATPTVKSGVTKEFYSLPILTGDLYVSGYKKAHPELCPSSGTNIQLLILIASAPLNSQARDAIRMTWGHYAVRFDISMAFFLGTPPHHSSTITAEDILYGDLIVGRFIDSYRNLTLKTLSMLEWVDTYCPQTKRLLKTDDDMFINIPNLMDFIKSPSRTNATKTIWGTVAKSWKPMRVEVYKNSVSQMQFPDEVYPDFATGPAYLMTTDMVKDILAAAPKEPYLNTEDVFITGVLGNKLGIVREHVKEFNNSRTQLNSICPCMAKRAIAVHKVVYRQQFQIWRKLLDGRKLKCLT